MYLVRRRFAQNDMKAKYMEPFAFIEIEKVKNQAVFCLFFYLLRLLRDNTDLNTPVLLSAGFGIIARDGPAFAVTDHGQP